MTRLRSLEGQARCQLELCLVSTTTLEVPTRPFLIPPNPPISQAEDAHSPQVGWAFDGFPVYGPRGPGGVLMQTCTVTGGTYGTDVCTDDCTGYWADLGDGYTYRYYILGDYQ